MSEMDVLGEFAEDPRVWPTTDRHYVVRPDGGPGYYVLTPRDGRWYFYEEDGGSGDPIVWGATAEQVLSEAIGDAQSGGRERHEGEVYLLAHAARMGGWLTTLGLNEVEMAWCALLAAEGLMVFIDDRIARYALTEVGAAVADGLRG